MNVKLSCAGINTTKCKCFPVLTGWAFLFGPIASFLPSHPWKFKCNKVIISCSSLWSSFQGSDHLLLVYLYQTIVWESRDVKGITYTSERRYVSKKSKKMIIQTHKVKVNIYGTFVIENSFRISVKRNGFVYFLLYSEKNSDTHQETTSFRVTCLTILLSTSEAKKQSTGTLETPRMLPTVS